MSVKTLTLKEGQSPYTLALDEDTLAEGPVRVLRGEQTIGVLVPPEEYEAFRAWRERQQRRAQAQQVDDQFAREVAAFERMLPELLERYRGQVVAIHDCQVVEIGAPGESVAEVAERAYDQIGYVPMYVQKVEETPRVYKITGPRLRQR